MAADQHAGMPVDVSDDAQCFVQLGEVGRDVTREVGRLMAAQAASVLAQVDGVEVDARADEEVREMGLKEIVGVAVDVEHGARGRCLAAPTDQGRNDRTLVVFVEVDRHALVRRAQHIFIHGGRLPRS
jgi:hypothetical protein